MKPTLLTTAILLLTTIYTQAQQDKWQVGVEAQLVFARYQTNDPGHLLKPGFSVPTGTGRLALGRSLNEQGLVVESGLGYRQIPQATALQLAPFNGFSATNGIGVWSIPIGLRQDVTRLLFPRHPPRVRLALKTGLLNQFAAAEGVEKVTFTQTGSGWSLAGHSTLLNHYSLALYTGIELGLPFHKIDLLLQWGQVYGLSRILITQIRYQLNGTSQQASVNNSGSALGGIGLGLRYHFTNQ
ncbi:hypothetical protein [Spirosoma lituiforme]